MYIMKVIQIEKELIKGLTNIHTVLYHKCMISLVQWFIQNISKNYLL